MVHPVVQWEFKTMSKPIRRGARYFVRRRVPVDLVDHYGRKEITRALGTADRREAVALCAAADDALNVEFAEARAALAVAKAKDSTAHLRTLTDAEYDIQETSRIEGEEEYDAETWAREHEEEAANRLTELLAARLGISRVALGLAVGHTRPHAAPMPLLTPETGQPIAAPVRAVPGVPARVGERTLSILVALWAAERKPDSRTEGAYKRAAQRFTEYTGISLVHKVTKSDVVSFKDKALEELSVITAKAHIGQLSTLFRFAMGRAWIESNPADGVSVTDKRGPAKGVRPPFDTATLNRLFNSPVYTRGLRPQALAGEAAYWLPLLALYTGARIEELCQLVSADVYQETYHDATGKALTSWVMRITDQGEGQKVKNAGSVRRIPLHPKLIKLGFLEYATNQTGRIFPMLKVDKHGRLSTAWGKAWHRDYLRKYCEPADSRMVFHSFRHTFKDICRLNGISREHADAIQGHTDGSASGMYGSQFYPLAPLVEAMNRYVVHGLRLA